MSLIIGLFNEIFLRPIINLLVLIFQGMEAINLPGSLGLSIIALTVIIRFLAWPFMSSQLKSTKKMVELKPHLQDLRKKHAADKQALAAAQMALYKEHGVNPAGGCLPALIQIPIFIALYQAIINIVPGAGGSIERLNSLLYFSWMKLAQNPDPSLFGINLGAKPSEFLGQGVWLLSVPILTAALTFIQSKMMVPEEIKKYPSDSPKEVKEKEGMEDTMAQMQSQMMYLMPVMIGYFAFSFPIGLAIYWNTYTMLGILQQYTISGWGGMSSWVKRLTLRTK